MNQRAFYFTATLIAAFLLLIAKPVPVSIYRIEGINEFDVRFQERRTIEKLDDEPSIYSELELVPQEYNSKCYSQWDHWVANGLADRLGNPIGWKRNVQWNGECESEVQGQVYEYVYSILLSRNPMITYPEFSHMNQKLLTETGVEVLLNKIDYPFTINGKTTVYVRNNYTFVVNDVYVFIEQTTLRETWSDKEICAWVDKLIVEIKARLI